MVLEKALENPLDCKEIQPVHSEGDQPWDFFGRNDVNMSLHLMGRCLRMQLLGDEVGVNCAQNSPEAELILPPTDEDPEA